MFKFCAKVVFLISNTYQSMCYKPLSTKTHFKTHPLSAGFSKCEKRTVENSNFLNGLPNGEDSVANLASNAGSKVVQPLDFEDDLFGVSFAIFKLFEEYLGEVV
jgi:hypothetical protein